MAKSCKTVGCTRPARHWANFCHACQDKQYRQRHPERYRAAKNRKNSRIPEKNAVRNHYKLIFKRRMPAYLDMPFYSDWNPEKGGSFAAGEQWIIDNIGKRPDSEHQLHIVEKSVGFMPGNLQWMPRNIHKRQELVPLLMAEVRRLRLEIATLRASQ